MPKAVQALQATSKYVNSSGLDHGLLELVKMRTSQLNGWRGWNRLNIVFRPEVGDYRPGMFDQPKTAHPGI